MKVVEELESLKSEILEMHKVARESVRLCFIAMRGRRDVVKEISKLEEKSDKMEADIHDHCARILIRFHPFARDFRFTMSAIRMSSAYERIVDLAQEIAIYECKFREKIFEAESVLLKMFDLILEGYSDSKKLLELSKLDDLVDKAYIEAMEEVESSFESVDEILAIRHIERIGDILCKIGARLLYAIEGNWEWIK
ncbi:MAG: PhoU domain-containing protein [Archaeoglobaceae archaeon]